MFCCWQINVFLLCVDIYFVSLCALTLILPKPFCISNLAICSIQLICRNSRSQLNISMSVSLYRPNYYLFICLVWFLFEQIPSPVTSGRWDLHVGRRLSLENCLHIDEKMRMWENCRWKDRWCDKHRIFHTYRKMLIQPSNLHLI